MGYLSISQTAEKWGISQRRIRILCVEGRIPGAFKMGAYWSIPDDAEKPKDKRIKTGRYIKEKSDLMRNKTIDYYNQNADLFVQGTVSVDFKETQDKFLQLLTGKKVLDFGCGSGRDTKYFLESGFDVTATDGSEELCKSASAYTGIQVKHMLFQDLNEADCYDGIWACSSILHLSKDELRIVINKMSRALKLNGIIYTSFKYGNFEGERNGRFFTDFTLELFKDFISDVKDIVIEEYWITGDVRPGREDEKWLNLILRKIAS